MKKSVMIFQKGRSVVFIKTRDLTVGPLLARFISQMVDDDSPVYTGTNFGSMWLYPWPTAAALFVERGMLLPGDEDILEIV